MINFNDVVLVWGESESSGMPAKSPSVSVGLWQEIVGSEWIRWNTSDIRNMPDVVRSAKVCIVNIFHTADSIHVEQIKQVDPSCYVLACPDAPIDLVLDHPEWLNIHRQLLAADAIGGRTLADCNVYSALLGKKSHYFPSPIGATEWFLPFRELPKEDYIITLDHSMSPANTMCNVAAVQELSRMTKLRVVYVAAREWTKRYADLAGLECTWLGHIPFTEMVDLTARAQYCVDIYMRHSYGRQQVLAAMVGTPTLGSNWCDDAPGFLIDPFEGDQGVFRFDKYINRGNRKVLIEDGYLAIKNTFSFDACRERLVELLSIVEVA